MRLALLAALLLAPQALLLAACGECDSCKQKDAPGTTAAAAPGPAAAVAAVDALEAPPAKPPEVQVAWRGTGDVIELSVWEMHCGGCELKVEESLGALPGVKAVQADHATSVVKVTLADAAQRETLIPKIRTTLKDGEFRVLGE